MELLGPDQLTMAAALRVRSVRADLLASNVANADTPGYLSRDLDFDAAVESVRDRPDSPAGTAAPGNALPADNLNAANPSEVNVRFDRNDVDVNQALAQAYDNSLNYVATLKLYGDSVQRLVSATSSN